MMSKIVIVDADDLENFSNQLKGFNNELEGRLSTLRAQFRRLGDTWRDPEYQKFALEFEQTSSPRPRRPPRNLPERVLASR